MSDAVLIFTLSPVQSFIAEARRTSDLYAGSRILVALARAAAQAIQQEGILVYPADPSADMPNKLVGVVPWTRATAAAERARQALLAHWRQMADTARTRFREAAPTAPPPDGAWETIWQRQTAHFWEVYWAAASLEGRGYAEAYQEAQRVLDAAKRTRAFEAVEEAALKDTLSGRREALHTAAVKAADYWSAVSAAAGPALLRAEGRERLDALGVIKRFGEHSRRSGQPLLSTSSVASADFLENARPHLVPYREAVQRLLGSQLYRVREDVEWPYDGDLFYEETLTPWRLRDSYGQRHPDAAALREAQRTLADLHHRLDGAPSPYYAVVALDGDDMGKRLDECLKDTAAQQAHRDLSARLARFAARVPALAAARQAHLIYNGGDDVLALAPLTQATAMATALAAAFKDETGGTASAGIAVVHHLYPLDAALEAARQAEQAAKRVKDKAAVCVRLLRRSGETSDMRSPWSALAGVFEGMVRLLSEGTDGQPLAARFPYDVASAAASLPTADAAFEAECRRLLLRHRNARHPQPPDPAQWSARLRAWAEQLPDQSEELARWLVFARFVAQRGSER